MCEFVIVSKLGDLFSVTSSKQYSVKKILSKQSVTVEILQLKRSMYDDPEDFICNQFDVYCNLIKLFGEFDDNLKITAFKVLLQVSEKMASSLSSILDADENLDEETRFTLRNKLKMAVFLLCQFTHAFEQDVTKKMMAANICKGRKKRTSIEGECSEWPDERLKFLVIIKKLFKLPIGMLWDPPTVEPELVNFVTTCFFKLLENTEVSRDKGMKTEIFRFLGTILSDYQTGLVYSVKIIQLLQYFEHLPGILAEAVIYFIAECSDSTLISDLCREATLLDAKVLVQNLTAAHSLSQFLISITDAYPEKVFTVISSLIQFLEWESHVMRNCGLSIVGIIVSKFLSNEDISANQKKAREELLGHLEAHILDVNSFVRSKAIQVLKMLLEEEALASVELHHIGVLITKRLHDKASNVRKNAMSFLAQFIRVNQFACQIPLPVLKESFQKEFDKLKEMKQNAPLMFDESDDEQDDAEETAKNAVIFDDSDEEEEINNKEGKTEETSGKLAEAGCQDKEGEKPDSQNKEGKKSDIEDKEGGKPDSSNDAPDSSNDAAEALQKQITLVNYLKHTLNFALVIHDTVEPVRALLHSQTQTDVLEAIEFISATVDNSVQVTDSGINEILALIWSKESAVKDAVLNAFKALYLSTAEIKREPADIARNLIFLLKGSNTDDALNIQEFIKHFCKLGEIPSSVPTVLWTRFSITNSDVTEEEKISNLMLLGMMAEVHPEVVIQRLESLVNIGLGPEAEKSFQLAMHIFHTLGKVNKNTRGKFTADGDSLEVRLPHDHSLVLRIKYFLIDGIKYFEDNQWIPMASEAVALIFSLIDEPTLLCAEIATKLATIVFEEERYSEEKKLTEYPNILLARFLSFCGHIALYYVSYLKIDYFAYLRQQETVREKRRKKSSLHARVSALQSNFVTPKSRTKKRQSFGMQYKLVPPADEETTYEQILETCSSDVQNEKKLVGALLPYVVAICKRTLIEFNAEIQAAASLALSKFMLISEHSCQDNMQLFATITERSPEPYIRANLVIAMGDLTTSYPNIVEPWTPQIYQRLKDPDPAVREASIIILTHLILHDFVRIKGLISGVAKCIADTNERICTVAKYLFTELSKKGNVIYNVIPDIISSLSDPKSGVDEETFQIVLRYMLQYVEKEKLIEGLVEKLCYRFTDSSTDIQIHELTFCLSILTLNDKCYSKLMEFKNLLKERMSDPVIMRYITNITANAKKNDAKTAAELEAFRKELGI